MTSEPTTRSTTPSDLLRLVRGAVAGVSQRVRAAYLYDAGEVDAPTELSKRRHLLKLFRERGHEVFVESGTYLGGAVGFMLPHARRIISVEIEPHLFEAARRKFAAEPKVELRLGDSAKLVPEVVSELREPPLVWLDGHFTGGVNEELKGEEYEPALRILESLGELGAPTGTTIVVDDLRLFGRLEGFPTLDKLTATARRAFPQADIVVGLDSLVVLA